MKKILCTILILSLTSCFRNDDNVFTLYRTNSFDSNIEVHVATFDADESRRFNRDNCEITRDLFMSIPGIVVKYMCKPGFMKK
jgi:hypothetical protein